MAKRRTAAQWAQIVRELERSSTSVEAFARARGIKPGTLSWWRWQLRQRAASSSSRKAKTKAKATTNKACLESVRLVAVKPVEEDRSASESPSLVWELVSPSGHVLRVYDRDGLELLEAALSSVSGSKR